MPVSVSAEIVELHLFLYFFCEYKFTSFFLKKVKNPHLIFAYVIHKYVTNISKYKYIICKFTRTFINIK
jgi:hypothetical protein